MNDSSQRIIVGIRIRPINKKENESGEKVVWKRVDDHTIVEITPHGTEGKTTYFDHVFDENNSTQNVYDKVTHSILDGVFNGFNGTIFAYGQTSSGKTHTLMGNSTEPGIIVLAIHDSFSSITQKKYHDFRLRMSYIEIYNEEIRDLLSNEGTAGTKYVIAEDKFRGPYVKGVHEEDVTSADQVLALLASGEEKRHFGATNMNLRSSRSHTLFKLVFESRKTETPVSQFVSEWEDGTPVNVAALNLVDLAGSERISKTGATGKQLKEGTMINKSLLTLGTVISKLCNKKGGAHIPYRDSKLTRLLSTSLGGNARTCMISAISPADSNRVETKSTLKFAERAQQIVNKVSANVVANAQSQLNQYKLEIEALRKKLERSGDEIQREHLEKQTELEALEVQARKEKDKAQTASAKLQKMQALILHAAKYSHTDKKAAEEMQQNLIAVSSGRRRLESIAIVNSHDRRLSSPASNSMRQIDMLREQTQLAESDSGSESNEDSEEKESDDESDRKAMKQNIVSLKEQLSMSTEEANAKALARQVELQENFKTHATLQNHLEKHMLENEELLKSLDEMEKREQSYIKSIQELEDSLQEKHVDLGERIQECTTSNDTIHRLTAELEQLRAETKGLEKNKEEDHKKMAESYDTLDEKYKTLQEAHTKLEGLLAQHEKEHQENTSELGRKHEALLCEYKNVQEKLQHDHDEHASLLERYEILYSDHSILDSKYRAMELDKLDLEEKLSTLQVELESESTKLKDVSQSHNSLLSDYDILKVQHQALQSDYHVLEVKLEKDHAKYQNDHVKHTFIASELDDLQLKHMALRSEHDNWIAQSKSLEDRVEQQTKTNQEAVAKHDVLQLNHNELHAQHKALELEYADINDQCKNLQSEFEHVSSKYNTLYNEHNTLHTKNQSLESAYEHLDVECKNLQQQLEQEHSLQKNLVAKHDTLYAEHSALNSKYKVIKSDHRSLQASHQELQRDYSKVEQESEALKSKLNGLKIRSEASEEKHREMECALRLENEKLDHKYSETCQATEALQTEYESLKSRNQTHVLEYESLCSRHEELKAEFQKVEFSLEQMKNDKVDMEFQLSGFDVLRKAYDDLTLKHESQEKTYRIKSMELKEELKKEVHSEKERQLKLNVALEQTQKELVLVTRECTTLKNKLQIVESLKEGKLVEIKDLQSEIDDLRLENAEVAAIKDERDKIQYEFEIIQQDLKAERHTVSNLLGFKSNAEKQLHEFDLTLKHKGFENSTLERECKRLESTIDGLNDLESQLSNIQKEKKSLEEQVYLLECSISTYDDEKQESLAVNNQLNRQMEVLSRRISEMEEDQNSTKQENTLLKRRAIECEHSSNTLENHLGQKDEICTRLQQEVEQLRQNEGKHLEEVNDMQMKLTQSYDVEKLKHKEAIEGIMQEMNDKEDEGLELKQEIEKQQRAMYISNIKVEELKHQISRFEEQEKQEKSVELEHLNELKLAREKILQFSEVEKRYQDVLFQSKEQEGIISSLEAQIEVMHQNRSVLEAEFSKLIDDQTFETVDTEARTLVKDMKTTMSQDMKILNKEQTELLETVQTLLKATKLKLVQETSQKTALQHQLNDVLVIRERCHQLTLEKEELENQLSNIQSIEDAQSNAYLSLQKDFAVQSEHLDTICMELDNEKQETNRWMKEVSMLRESQALQHTQSKELKCALEECKRELLSKNHELKSIKDLLQVVDSSFEQHKSSAQSVVDRFHRKLDRFRQVNDELKEQLRLADEQVEIARSCTKQSNLGNQKNRETYDKMYQELIFTRKELETVKTKLLIKENKICQLSRIDGSTSSSIQELQKEVFDTKREWREYSQIAVKKYEAQIQQHLYENTKLKRQLFELAQQK